MMTPEKAVASLQDYLSNQGNGIISTRNTYKHYTYKFPKEITTALKCGDCISAMKNALIECDFKANTSSPLNGLVPGQFVFVNTSTKCHVCDLGCQRHGCPIEKSKCSVPGLCCSEVIVCLPW